MHSSRMTTSVLSSIRDTDTDRICVPAEAHDTPGRGFGRLSFTNRVESYII